MRVDTGSQWGDDAVRRLIDELADPVICYSLDGLVLYSNRAHERMFGHDPGGLVGGDLVALFPEEHHNRVRKTLLRMASLTPDNRTVTTVTELRPLGTLMLHEWTNTAQFDDDGDLVGILAVGRDMTRLHLQAARDAHEARHDPLTGVLNRAVIAHHLRQRWSEGRALPDLTVVFLDLDGFKDINDRFGHSAGDATLIAVSDALGATVRPQDIVGRMGGDEFVLVLNGSRDADLAATRIPQIVAALESLEVGVGVSCGLAVPERDETWASVIRRADAEMLVDKASRRKERTPARAS